MEYSITADAEFLRVRVSGRDTDQPPSDVCAIIYRESESSSRLRILIELDQQFPLSSVSQHQLITRLPSIGFAHQHRIALVHRTMEQRTASEFINLVAMNRGVNVRNFPSVHDAEAWLRET